MEQRRKARAHHCLTGCCCSVDAPRTTTRPWTPSSKTDEEQLKQARRRQSRRPSLRVQSREGEARARKEDPPRLGPTQSEGLHNKKRTQVSWSQDDQMIQDERTDGKSWSRHDGSVVVEGRGKASRADWACPARGPEEIAISRPPTVAPRSNRGAARWRSL